MGGESARSSYSHTPRRGNAEHRSGAGGSHQPWSHNHHCVTQTKVLSLSEPQRPPLQGADNSICFIQKSVGRIKGCSAHESHPQREEVINQHVIVGVGEQRGQLLLDRRACMAGREEVCAFHLCDYPLPAHLQPFGAGLEGPELPTWSLAKPCRRRGT